VQTGKVTKSYSEISLNARKQTNTLIVTLDQKDLMLEQLNEEVFRLRAQIASQDAKKPYHDLL
jgi:hypothetical protein